MEGGTSNVNALIYLRGHPRDYDEWARITGNPIWNYANITKFYKKFENFVDNDGKQLKFKIIKKRNKETAF